MLRRLLLIRSGGSKRHHSIGNPFWQLRVLSSASSSLLHPRMPKRLFRQRRRHLSLCPTDQQGIRFGGSLRHHSGGHFFSSAWNSLISIT